MKRIFLATAVISVISVITVISCNKNKPGTVSFTSLLDFTTTIPAQPELPLIDTPVTVSTDISIKDKRLNNCDRASLRSFYIEIQAPKGQTFDFCKEVRLSLSASGAGEAEIASAANINPNATRVDFVVSDNDMARFVHQSSMTVKLRITLGRGIKQPVTVYGNLKFNVQSSL